MILRYVYDIRMPGCYERSSKFQRSIIINYLSSLSFVSSYSLFELIVQPKINNFLSIFISSTLKNGIYHNFEKSVNDKTANITVKTLSDLDIYKIFNNFLSTLTIPPISLVMKSLSVAILLMVSLNACFCHLLNPFLSLSALLKLASHKKPR